MSATVSRTVPVPPEGVWAALSDGWLYATWVVGACRVRAVDLEWPAVGSRIHHSFGIWPVLINDESTVKEASPERELVLVAQGWPVGEATVRIRLEPVGTDATKVTLTEDATAGPGRLVPEPLRRLALLPRNKETLRRLDLVARGRHRERNA
jgi:uncharacterized protein YndB with AHSA1/START domain